MKTWLKIDRWIDIVQTWICIVLFVLILFFGSIQIFGRYIFGVSTPWSEELMRFSAIWLTMVGSALTIRVDGHVSVDILLGFMKNNKARSVLF
ncbi:TRAP transporter small permease, partial [Anaerotruncus rubiinfantis]